MNREETPFTCPFCDSDKFGTHLIVVMDKDGKTHVHGPMDNPTLTADIIKAIAKEANIEVED